jgi:hypothetical protein
VSADAGGVGKAGTGAREAMGCTGCIGGTGLLVGPTVSFSFGCTLRIFISLFFSCLGIGFLTMMDGRTLLSLGSTFGRAWWDTAGRRMAKENMG